MLFSKTELGCNNFSINKSEDNATKNEMVVCTAKAKHTTSIYNISDKCNLSDFFSSFEDGNDIEIISKGAFSMHQLVRYIISIIEGPCNIYATTWATCEKVVSFLVNLKQSGQIKNCYFLFDHRVLKYRPNAYALFAQNFESKILSIHAKICVIEGQNIKIRIVGSGNWTRNDKIEIYNISSDEEICKHHINYITNELNI